METIVFQIELNDGRVFKVFCANSTQKKRVIQSSLTNDKVKEVSTITNGLHTAKQYEQILNTL